MTGGIKKKFVQLFTASLMILIIGGGLMMMWPNYKRSQELKNKASDLRAQIEAKHREISKLKECQRRFKSDPDFIEAIARQNHRVFPGELVFIFEGD